MFEKLIDFLISIIDDVKFWVIIREYQNAVVLRYGKFNKVLTPGIWFKIPFLDEVSSHFIAVTTISLPAQSLSTKDNKSIVVEAVVKYNVDDVKKYVLDIFDSTDAIKDIAMSTIKKIIMPNTWDELKEFDIDNEITKKIRAEVKKYGIYVHEVTLTSLDTIRSYRLINETKVD
jgi:regulator of protease activity HflC (stomatin/prohibitin superfamily)